MLPWPVASKPNSILGGSSVTCVELARQNIARNFWATKRLALGKPALKMSHASAHLGLRPNCDRHSAARKFIVGPTSARREALSARGSSTVSITASHWKYIIGDVIVYRDVYRADLRES